jgi:glycerophosphoryl diester phosphodiesterase
VTDLPVRRALRLAHRGDWRVAPENTLGAMAAALAIPACDGLEFDVRGSADGVPVLLHDPTLARVQGIDAAVADLTAEELARYGIPSLAEILTATLPASGPGGKDWPFLDVELKGAPVPAVIEVLEAERGAMLERTVVSSFEVETLRWLGEQRPAWPRWLNAMNLSGFFVGTARDLGCTGIAVEWSSIDEAGMDRARAEGLEVAAWTVRDLATYSRLEAMGVMAMCVEAAALDG